MPAPRIPERQAIYDPFTGVIVQVDDHFLLSSAAIVGHESLHAGTFVVRYGVVYLGKPQLSIVPALMALDYGAFKTGEDAWHFLLHKSNLHPRADVIGHRNDGVDAQVYVKELDLLYPFDVLVYADETTTSPLCKVDAVISQHPDDLPSRLADYVSIFDSVDTWREAL